VTKTLELLFNFLELNLERPIHRRDSLLIFASRSLVISFACVAVFASSGCGKRRPPTPPVEKVPQRTELLTGVQRGNTVILTWPAPIANAPDSSVQSIRRIDVYRLAESPTAPLPLTETEFDSRSTLVGSVSDQSIHSARNVLSYVDHLELAGQPERLRYSVRYVNAAGQRAGFSNFVLIEPTASIVSPPILKDPAYTETAINLSWSPPSKNIDGSTPVNLLGYNLYRNVGKDEGENQVPLNTALIAGSSYADKAFKFGEKYNYFVRAVSLGSNGHQVESLDSNAIEASPVDKYPPAQPSKPTIAASNGRLALFFAPNVESDLAGYNLYRSEDPNLPFPDKWTKLNTDLLTKTTYQDERVESGHRYYYRITAVDTSGNVSEPSEMDSELAP
jgi:fibronectin type 3 domain-containing protein